MTQQGSYKARPGTAPGLSCTGNLGEIMMHLDKAFVDHWSERYEVDELGPSADEHGLLTVTHTAIGERGYLTPDELEAIARWKSQRVLDDLETDGDTIKDVTSVALASATPPWMRHHILCILGGVRHAMASAILTVWDPETQSIFDVRVIQALRELQARQALALTLPADLDRGYWTYMKTYRTIAADLGVSYRSLDRALWKWNKDKMPWTWPGGPTSDSRPDGGPANAG